MRECAAFAQILPPTERLTQIPQAAPLCLHQFRLGRFHRCCGRVDRSVLSGEPWSCPAFGGYLNVEIQEKMFIKSDEIVDMHSLFA
jgi:hypothetical protein